MLTGVVAGGASIWLASLATSYKALLALALASYAAYLLKLYHLGWAGRTPVALRWNVRHKQIQLRRVDGDWDTVVAVKDVAVLPYMVVLRLTIEGAKFPLSCCVFFDATDSDSFRRLRVFALHGAIVT